MICLLLKRATFPESHLLPQDHWYSMSMKVQPSEALSATELLWGSGLVLLRLPGSPASPPAHPIRLPFSRRCVYLESPPQQNSRIHISSGSAFWGSQQNLKLDFVLSFHAECKNFLAFKSFRSDCIIPLSAEMKASSLKPRAS